MRFPRFSLLVVCVLFTELGFAQQTATTVQRDPQALLVLQACVSAAGGSTTLGAIQDVTATGNITYNWAGQQVQGAVTLRQKGADEFRLDANLPDGIRSWAVSFGAGSIKEMAGTSYLIGFANAVNLGALSLPLVEIYTNLQDPSTSLVYVGSSQIAGRMVQQIHVQRNYSAQVDPDGSLGKLTGRDFFVDATNFQLLVVRDLTHPNENFHESYAHEINFSDYRLVDGLLVPFSIGEKISGQQTWTIQLSSINFNTGLTDADFLL